MAHGPWASGPKEILEHGVSLLRQNSDRSRRLAMLSIDNAVELIIKTYLGLPKRVTGLSINRKQYEEMSHSFPKLLDGLENHAADKLRAISLGEIEWYHRLRNQLYHDGNGLTVERKHVEIYAEIAILLFKNLFGSKLELVRPKRSQRIGQFLELFSDMWQVLHEWFQSYQGSVMAPASTPKQLARKGVMSRATAEQIEQLQIIRNTLAHSTIDDEEIPEIRPDTIAQIQEITDNLRSKLDKKYGKTS